MNTSIILALESRLKNAMLASDLGELNVLLNDELIFTNHLGQLMTKRDDLQAHESGVLKIDKIDLSEQEVKLYDGFALVNVVAKINGSYNGESTENSFRFSRVWRENPTGLWQLVLAHSTKVV